MAVLCSVCGQDVVYGCDCATQCSDCPTVVGADVACSSSCGCETLLPATPTPYYAEGVGSCEQDNTQKIYIQSFYTSIKTSSVWNIPACGETAVLVFPNLKGILAGASLWSSAYGYFAVEQFNATTSEVTIRNNCILGNAPVGVTVPACTEFIIAPPSCCSGGEGQDSLLFPYVAVDFTAPADATCILITVTSVNGLGVGKLIQIGSGTYRIDSISSSENITICNDGSGIIAGTPVIAKNLAGDYQYPIIQLDTNPCTNDTVVEGSLIACNAGAMAPLTGSVIGMIPVLQDPVTGEVEFKTIGIPTDTCTNLTLALVLNAANPGPYPLIVADSSGFLIGDILQLGTRTDRFTVTLIPSATQINATVDPVPGNEIIPAGTSVCIIGCCEDLQLQVDAIVVDVADVVADLAAETAARIGADGGLQGQINQMLNGQASARNVVSGGTINSGATLFVSPDATIVFNNTNPASAMSVMYTIDAYLDSEVANTAADLLDFYFSIDLQINGGAPVAKIITRHLPIKEVSAINTNYDPTLHFSDVASIPALGTLTLAAFSSVVWIGSGAASLAITQVYVRISGIGVSVGV